MLENLDLIVTGGAGTLGLAIAERRKREGWKGRFTVYSTDTHKHEGMKRLYPDVNFIQGDIRNPETLYNAMVGHDVCLHLGAVKVIPTSEFYSLDTIDVNINGSLNVCIQAANAKMGHVLGISTDKVCHAANAYGATKYLMEKIFQEYARAENGTKYHLARYGNVLESTGSVLEAWKNSVTIGQPIKITDPEMTRFWISPQQAVDLVKNAVNLANGMILIPKMKSLSIGKLAQYTLDRDYSWVKVPLRPGEKMHETLLTVEECQYADEDKGFFYLSPTTNPKSEKPVSGPYTSDTAQEMTKGELEELLSNE